MSASTWWPTPTAPSKWFSAEQITNSSAYHRPPATMSGIAVGISIVLAVGVSLLATGTQGQTLAWVLTPLAVLIPMLAYRWWYYDRHRPAFGAAAKPPAQILLSSVTTTALAFAAINAFVIIVRTQGTTLTTLLLLVGIAMAAALMVSSLNVDSKLEPVADLAVAPFQSIAEWAGIRCQFLVDNNSEEVNARAVRVRGRRTVIVSAGLLNQSAELQSLVVAHEVAHLQLGHVTKLRLVGLVHAGSVAALGWLIALAIGDRVDDAEAYPLLVLSLWAIWWLTTPARAFVKRHFERQADQAGYDLLGTVSTNLGRQLFAKQYSNLEPGLAQKLFSDHPPPAERLELISRRIKTL